MKPRHAEIGPCPVPGYPVGAWSKRTDIDMREVWKLCGPTVHLLMDKMPLWQVFACVYIEAIGHGAAMQRELSSNAGVKRLPAE